MDGCHRKRCVQQTGMYSSSTSRMANRAWQGPSLQPHREHTAIRHRGLDWESRALFDGRWLVWEGPSSNNTFAALPTDVSVYTWLSQAVRFKRAVVTSNVECVMMSKVDMIRYCRFNREDSISRQCPGRRVSCQPSVHCWF